MLTFKNILCPTDFSASAAKALELAAAVAHDPEATIHICHVLPPAALAYGEVVTDLAVNAHREAAQKQLDSLPVPAGIKVQKRLLEGEPSKEIVGQAMAVKADLLVLGTHGRTGLMRLLMGSVAEHVLRHAPCPVLAWRQPETN